MPGGCGRVRPASSFEKVIHVLLHTPARTRIAVRLTTLLLAFGLAGGLGAAVAVADEQPAVAWMVQTVDNEYGSQRANFDYSVDPGEMIHDALLITNTGTAALPLKVYAADAFTTTIGNLDLVAGDVPSTDAGLWISVETPEIVIQPGQYAEIPFTIAVPADASPGDHPAGVVSSFLSEDSTQSLSVDRRLGSRVNLRVSGELMPAAVVGDVTARYIPSLNPFAPGTLVLDYTLTNSGNTRVTAAHQVTAGGPIGILPVSAPSEQLAEVTPRSAIDVHREVAAASLGWIGGTLTIVPEGIGLGARGIDPIIATFDVVAVPWTLFGLLAVAAVLTVLIVAWVRRQALSRASMAADSVEAP